LPANVRVLAVVGGAATSAQVIARGVRLLLADASHPSGTVLELGKPAHRG